MGKRYWLVVFALGLGSAAAVPVRPPDLGDSTPAQGDVHLTGPPTWWLEDVESNPRLGRLYFGAEVENRTQQTMWVGLSFQSYLADGTRFEGCHGMGGDGSGVAVEVAPRERAFMVCNRSLVERDKVNGLQVTARMWDVHPVSVSRARAEVIESGLIPGEDYGYVSGFSAFARVRTAGSADVRAKVLFRFYSEDGVQVETCASGTVTIEPEVAVRAMCWGAGVSIARRSPQPTTVRAEARASDW